MAAKDYRNGIITLVILGIGIKLLTQIGKGYTAVQSVPMLAGVINSLESVSNLFLLGIAALIIIFIPLYLSKRSSEKKARAKQAQPQG